MNFRLLLIICYTTDTIVLFRIHKNLDNKYHKLREKINKILNTKEENLIFANVNDYEYPRANASIRKIHRELWSEYYECLKRTYMHFTSERMIGPTAIVALEGTSLTLKCQICISPRETNEIDIIDWFYSNAFNENPSGELLEYTEDTLISPEDYQLSIYNVQSSQAGRYWCKMGDTVAGTYYLHVDKSREISIVRPDEAPDAPHAATEQILAEYNLRMYTTWTRWSDCSSCDFVGQKIRYGYCFISMIENSTHTYSMAENLETSNETNEQYLKVSETESRSKKRNKELLLTVQRILPLFRNKLPCRSIYTPEIIQQIPEVKTRKNEMMLRFCKQPCPKNVVFEVRDKKGNIIESANNSAGIYSVIQGIPEPPPSVTRVTLYQKHNQKTVLRCPGNLHTDSPITWKVGNKRLIPSVIEEQSFGRIRVNPLMHIIFKKLKFADANIYSCWQNDELTGTIKLNVSGEIEVRLNHHVFITGAIVIVGVFLMVFWKAFRGRSRYTIH